MWDLAIKRVETFMSRGKCLAESSPGEDYTDPKWKPLSPHEAPPARGIMSLYNRGTRARWYWPCQHCGEFFEAKPGIGAFAVPPIEELKKLPPDADLHALAEKYAVVPCPHCGALHEPRQKRDMNLAGMWVHEGQSIQGGKLVGERRASNIASYWLGGVAASYQRWESILLKYLQAVQVYVLTGEETALRAVTNTDTGAPYLSLAAANKRSSEHLVNRASDWPRGQIPQGVRFLTAAVDVQSQGFVCEVWGWGVGLERWLVDRFTIAGTRERDGGRVEPISPASYVEDWDVVIDQVIEREIGGMKPVLTLCDSGGTAGVTEKAYEFWRRARARGLGKRLMLVKGTGRIDAPRAKLTWPDSQNRKDRQAGGRGDVPVWLLNVNVLKDGIWGDLSREDEGPGYVHFPTWLTTACPTYYDELTVEVRTDKGWKKPAGTRNEAFDLQVYNRAACIVIKAEQIDWNNPPLWASATPVAQAPRPTNRRRIRSGGIRRD